MTTILQPAENSRRGAIVLEHSRSHAPMSPDEIRIIRKEHETLIQMQQEEDRMTSVAKSSTRIHATSRTKAKKSGGWGLFGRSNENAGNGNFGNKATISRLKRRNSARVISAPSRRNQMTASE